MSVTAVAPWFGSNRMLASEVGKELAGCEWVGIPFAGGMSEVFAMDARTINVNDLHRHVINMATVMADRRYGPILYRILRRVPFHPASLRESQDVCQNYASQPPGRLTRDDFINWAAAYFCSAWMTRHGSAGTRSEFNSGISTRWNASGGDSAAHYQGAVRAINTLRRTLRRCNFTTLDFREFLAKCKDQDKHGIYCDPPFPGPGDKYTHSFRDSDHETLADALSAYKQTRVVVRYYDVPRIRFLYPASQWTWRALKGRKQTNEESPEVLIMNGPSK